MRVASGVAGSGQTMPVNVFVLGLDELNLETLSHLPRDEYAFHPVFHKDELIGVDDIDLPVLLEEAERQLRAFDGPIDAIVGYWDFPVSSMVPILCERFGVAGPPLESVVKCEHKYWSRLEQRKAIDEVPEFAVIGLDEHELPPNLSYPVWLKPVKSVSSELAFRVDDRAALEFALAEIRSGIDKYAEPFSHVLERLELPPEIADVGAAACLAEEAATGLQLTVEGYSSRDGVHVHGVIDSLTYPDRSSFLRYQYPSRLPEDVRRRLADLSERVVRQVGLVSATFNIEYFYDPETDRIQLLEVNPRHSQSHARMFELVEGVSNHELQVELALGRAPARMPGAGPYDVAAKCFLRAFDDGVVASSPSPADLERVEQELPGVTVRVVAGTGDRLSELPQQDSYSYELAQVFVGARDEAELIEKYEHCVRLLDFDVRR
jgi:biotin carboxylase